MYSFIINHFTLQPLESDLVSVILPFSECLINRIILYVVVLYVWLFLSFFCHFLDNCFTEVCGFLSKNQPQHSIDVFVSSALLFFHSLYHHMTHTLVYMRVWTYILFWGLFPLTRLWALKSRKLHLFPALLDPKHTE